MDLSQCELQDKKTIIEKLEVFASKIITDFSDKIVYHDIKYAHRFIKHVKLIGEKEKLSEAEFHLAIIVAWFHTTTFGELAVELNVEDKKFKTNYERLISKYLKQFTKENEINEQYQTYIISILKNINFPPNITNKIEAVIVDSINYEFVTKKTKKHLKLLYEQMVLRDIKVGKKSFYDFAISTLEAQRFHTAYGKKELEVKFFANIEELKKDKKALSKQEALILQKELNINEEELKQLKKNLRSSKGRDDRGIQTLFRTTSKNHYTLNTMIDRKANIMITVNSIIFSLVVGGILGEGARPEHLHDFMPIAFLAISSLLSIIFAILSIRPEKTHGKFTEDEIRNKQGNLLFFGNFHKMHPKDFEWGMLQLLNDGKYLYTSMIKDLYYLGLTLSRKNKLIRISLNIFILGFLFSAIAFVYGQCLH